MQALRITLTQSKANYKRAENIENWATYPLPFFSSVIGAIHSACNYKEFHEMNISIQGTYETMTRDAKKKILKYNTRNDDRGVLVHFSNSATFSNAYTKVAKSKARGSSYKYKKDILIYNDDLLNNYIKIIKTIPELRKKKKETEDKENIKEIQRKIDSLKSELDCYAVINNYIIHVESLHNVRLVIHIAADQETLTDIEKNINNLKCIGSSEDVVNVESCELVELTQANSDIVSNNGAFIDVKSVRAGDIVDAGGEKLKGTIYKIDKDYKIINNKRVFNNCKCVYISDYKINKYNNKIYTDDKYIVNLN